MSQTNVQKIHNLYIYIHISDLHIYICMYILTKVLHCLWGCIKPNIHISSCIGHRSGRAEPFPWNYVFTCNAKAFRVRDVEHFFFFSGWFLDLCWDRAALFPVEKQIHNEWFREFLPCGGCAASPSVFGILQMKVQKSTSKYVIPLTGTQIWVVFCHPAVLLLLR